MLSDLGSDSFSLSKRFMAYTLFDGLANTLDQTAELRAARGADPRNPYLVGDEAYNLLCLGNDREAETVARELPGARLSGSVLVLTALGRADGRAAALRAHEASNGSGLTWSYRFEAAPLLFTLDRTRLAAVAKELSVEAERQPPRDSIDWRPCLAFLGGTLSEAELLATLPPNPNGRVYRYYFVGWKRLGDGDRDGARKAFEEAYQQKRFNRWLWMLTRAILIRMKDPNWPQAILEKKG